MAITPAYVREDWRYSVADLREFFVLDESLNDNDKEKMRDERLKTYIKELLSRNILKSVKAKKSDDDEVEEANVEYASYSDDELLSDKALYKYDFVGIVICEHVITYAYPKYIGEPQSLPIENPVTEMQQVMKVIEKYSRTKSKQDVRDVDLFDDVDENGKVNTLSVMLYILEDYANHGEYEDDAEILEINGSGEIYWQKTIDETYPIISDNKPYYVELYTRRKISNDASFIKRLHAYAVTCCSSEIELTGLTDFYSLPTADISDDEEETFGDTDTIIDRIDLELTQVFDDRKISLLRALRLYFKSGKILLGDNEMQVMGTRSFNLIWEEVCAYVFKSQKTQTVDKIEPKIDYTLINKKFDSQPPTLVELIEQPIWKKYDKDSRGLPKRPLNPDHLRFEKFEKKSDYTGPLKYVFYILDAKYYSPVWTDDNIVGQPGVEDITKQYLYYLTYEEILRRYHVTDVRNYFLMPKRKTDPKIPGFVKLDTLRNLGLGVVEVRMLDPEMMYTHYLDEDPMSLSELQ